MNAPRPLRDKEGRYQRPALERETPDRAFAGYYRSAEGEQPGIGGRTVRSAEEAVVAAVRMAYQVADEQIDRSKRLASRLKQAGDAAAGPDSEVQALDAIERFGLKLMMAALAWVEAASAEPGSPLKRMAAAQYRLFGNLFGIVADPAPHGGGQNAAASGGPKQRPPQGMPLPPVKYTTEVRRAILDSRVRLPASLDPGEYDADFYCRVPGQAASVMAGKLIVDREDRCHLELPTRADCPAGWWSAAVCTRDGMALGTIEIKL
jgi:hypothetical protein